MPYDNTLYLMGYLGSDPEGGYFADGNAHAKISVACNDRRRDKDGKETDHVEWFTVLLRNKPAEFALHYLKKGNCVAVWGSIWSRHFAEETKHREALNIVLSMPAGTPPQAVLNAAREFAAEQFDGHRYAFGLHYESDDPKEPPHPHVHLCVLLRDSMGQRINPRKNDLFEWRVRFAEKLRDEGVQCAATRRQHRGKTVKGQNGTVRAIDQRLAKRRSGGKAAKSRVSTKRESSLKAALQNDRRPDNPYRRKSTDTRAELVKRYKGLARSLYASGMRTEARDIAKLAQQLAEAGHDTRMQQEYDKQRTALLQLKQKQAHKQPETPTPQRPERDNGDIER